MVGLGFISAKSEKFAYVMILHIFDNTSNFILRNTIGLTYTESLVIG
jgi:hypothetical protein